MEDFASQKRVHRIGVNAGFLRKPGTGIGEVTEHILEYLMRLRAQNPSLHAVEIYLYVSEKPVSQVACALPKGCVWRIIPPQYRRDDLVRKLWWEMWTLPRAVRADGCTAFLSLYQAPTVFSRAIRHVMIVHDVIPLLFPAYCNNWRKKIDWWLTERGIRRATHCIAVSVHTEKDLIAHLGIHAGAITVALLDCAPIFRRPVSDAQRARVHATYHTSPGYLLFGGGLDLRKNADGVLRAYHKIRTRFRARGIPDHAIPRLVIMGRLQPQLAPLVTDVMALVHTYHLGSYVTITGFVPQEDLPALYADATCFVYPSLYEGFGLPPLEAMACGAPVVVSKTTSLPEVCGDAALYCDPQDPEDIARACEKVLTDKDLRHTLRMRAAVRVQKFRWDHCTQTVLDCVMGAQTPSV